MKYKRVPGGEKTTKSGVIWTKDELKIIFDLFIELKGLGIHENNPKIHKLSLLIQRSVRSIEAQLLMFRALAKNKAYSHKNMNKLCEVIWSENVEIIGKSLMASEPNLFKYEIMHSNNNFLKKLIELQQDGSGSISAPKNWLEKPLLYVNTELDATIDEIILKIKDDNQKGVWLFLMGAPGNGKSALTGKIVRDLYESGYSFFCYENYTHGSNKNTFDFTTCGDILPYKIEVKHFTNEYSICSIIQDASVLKKVGDESPNPALDLISSLTEAKKRGTSMIVCANRGILEEADRLGKESNIFDSEIIRIIRRVIQAESGDFFVDGKNIVNSEIHFKSNSLEQRSLVIGKPFFKELIKKAILPTNWDECEECSNSNFCPFYLNQKNLNQEQYLNNLLKILAQYEAFSGQVIVFREAIAIVSSILAGSSEDYVDHSGNPCSWVTEMVNKQDWFSLLSRRIYSTIYNPYQPLGITKKEIEKINGFSFFKAKPSMKLNEPSNDSGVIRILGKNGVAEEIHPLKNSRRLINDSNLTFDILKKENSDLISQLEEKCFHLWDSILNSLEEENANQLEEFIEIKRWISSNTFNIAFFIDGLTKFTEELEPLIKIYSEGNGNDDLLDKLEDTLKKLIGERELPISLSTKITEFDLKIEIIQNNNNDLRVKPYGLQVVFGAGSTSTFLDTRTLCHLIYKSNYHLDSITFPAKLLEQLEMNQLVAARKSGYNIASSLKLLFEDSSNREIEINRSRGKVKFQ